MKRLGLIGGLGTLAGVDLVQRMVRERACHGAHEDGDFPDFVYLNIVTAGMDSQGQMPNNTQIISSLDRLRDDDCDFALILCNTAHLHFSELESAFPGFLLNMVKIAADRACQHASPSGKIAVLQSRMARDSRLYENLINRGDRQVITTNDKQQALVDELISECMKGCAQDMTVKFHQLQADLWRQGAEQIIVGCTELSMIPRHSVASWGVIDAGFVAIEEAVRLCQ